jgi:hypothetical protein
VKSPEQAAVEKVPAVVTFEEWAGNFALVARFIALTEEIIDGCSAFT